MTLTIICRGEKLKPTESKQFAHGGTVRGIAIGKHLYDDDELTRTQNKAKRLALDLVENLQVDSGC